MSDFHFAPGNDFPPRRSTHIGEWLPLYLELQPGSGERVCIGVVAQDGSGWHVHRVERLDDLRCAYGQSAAALSWSAQLVWEEVRSRLKSGGLSALVDWRPDVDGLIIGEIRRGAGVNLSDLAATALTQVSLLSQLAMTTESESSIYELLVSENRMAYGLAADVPSPRLDAEVRRIVTSIRPQFRERFGHKYRLSQSSRPLRFGYVGRSLVANFAALSGKSAGATSAQVDKAKARLWDLKQLQSGVLADSLELRPQSMSYELLVHRPWHPEPQPRANNLPVPSFVAEAEEELEAEADKFEIRFRAFRSTLDIAHSIVERDLS